MAFWLYVTNSDNWKVTKAENIIGAAERYTTSFSRIKKGDKVFIYVKKQFDKGASWTESTIVGEYETASEVFEGTQKLFHTPELAPDEFFRLRVKVKPVKVPREPLKFRPLVPILDFIKNKNYWQLTLRGVAVISIPEHDCRLISSKL